MMDSQSTLNLSDLDLEGSDGVFSGGEKVDELPEEPIDPRSLLTPEQVQQYKDMFTILDTQGHGRIPTKLLGTIIRSLGHNPTKLQIEEYKSMADPEGKGLMDFQGFLLPIAELMEAVPESFEDVLQAFKILDENDLGYITTSELKEYLTTLGEYLEDFEIDLLIKLADPKGEGNIMYEEFLEKQFGIQKKKPKGKGGKKKK